MPESAAVDGFVVIAQRQQVRTDAEALIRDLRGGQGRVRTAIGETPLPAVQSVPSNLHSPETVQALVEEADSRCARLGQEGLRVQALEEELEEAQGARRTLLTRVAVAAGVGVTIAFALMAL